MRRAVRAEVIDLIREGLTPAELQEGGRRAIHNALVSTAMSYLNKAQGYPEWHAALLMPSRHGPSRLGEQARCVNKGGQRHWLTDVEVTKQVLDPAWKIAEAKVAQSPAWTKNDVLQQVEIVARFAQDPKVMLTDAERSLIALAVELGRKRGTTRVTLPVRLVRDQLGISHRAAYALLDQVAVDGLMRRIRRGKPGAPNPDKPGRAAIYDLPSYEAMATRGYAPTPVPGTPACVPQPQAYVPPVMPNVPAAKTYVPGAAARLAHEQWRGIHTASDHDWQGCEECQAFFAAAHERRADAN